VRRWGQGLDGVFGDGGDFGCCVLYRGCCVLYRGAPSSAELGAVGASLPPLLPPFPLLTG
jgi:hypothetical protein